MTHSIEEQEALKFLPDLQDYNTVSSLKNEKATAVIRMLLARIESDRRSTPKAVVTSNPIFFVQHNVQRDGYSGWHWEEEPDLELGYFTTQEAAQEAADAKNNYKGRWEEYVRNTTAKNEQAERVFEQRQKDHEKAAAAGLGHLVPAPVRSSAVTVLDFDAWVNGTSVDEYYDVVEVQPA